MRLQAVALESGPSETELTTPFAFGDNPAQTLFDKGLQSCPLSVGQLTGFLKEAIWYLYGCFHMSNHIIVSNQMSMGYSGTSEGERCPRREGSSNVCGDPLPVPSGPADHRPLRLAGVRRTGDLPGIRDDPMSVGDFGA